MFIKRLALVCAFSLSLGTSAMAAESQASSMAGGMNDSTATTNTSSMSSQNASNESSGQSGSSSFSSRASQSHNYDSSLTGDGAVKNVVGSGASLQNLAEPAKGPGAATVGNSRVKAPTNLPVEKATSEKNGGNGLIQNNVHQSDLDFRDGPTPNIMTGGAVGSSSNTSGNSSSSSVSTSSSTAVNVAPHVPHAKVQYWNRVSSKRTRHYR